MADTYPLEGYESLTREQSENLPGKHRHCVHIMLHCALPAPGVHLFNNKAIHIQHTALMMMRHDGRLGFPGGFVDADDANLEYAALRELTEELGEVPDGFEIVSSDYHSTHRRGMFVLHFYLKEVTFEDFLTIETRNGEQDHQGFEVLGTVRVPLYVMNPRDPRSGFPAFLRNNFIGNSKQQMLEGIRVKGLLSDELLKQYIEWSCEDDELSTCGGKGDFGINTNF